MKNNLYLHQLQFIARILVLAMVLLISYIFAGTTYAATLSLSPSTGVYESGSTFTVSLVVNTQGQAINSAQAKIKYNPNELSVVSANTGSLFNLWVQEPTANNSLGEVTFSGGTTPPGYTGSRGTIMSVTFRAKGSGSSRVTVTEASVLAFDGRGSNVLTSAGSGSYTLQTASVNPEPEVIVEYVPPANTPSAPVITSNTHPGEAWSQNTTAELSWSLPAGITSVRTLLNGNPTSVPTRVYEDPISSITLEDLEEGVQYFHLQFRNSDGWGRVTHYRLAVDTVAPSRVALSQSEDTDFTSPNQTIHVETVDQTSGVSLLKVKLDDREPFEIEVDSASSTFTLEELEPGYHTVIVEAIDQAGNSFIGTYSFTVLAFDRPVFTDYPEQLNEGVIPVIKGQTRSNATVKVTVGRLGSEPATYEVVSDESGIFTFIPEGSFLTSVYELTARAVDQYGAQSEPSEAIRIAVQQPGYIQIGSFIVSILSVLIPLIILVLALILGLSYLYQYLRQYRSRVRIESTEALEILRSEFTSLQKTLRSQEHLLQESRKTKKLTKAESDMIEVFDRALQNSQRRVEKEIQDVQNLGKKKTN